MYFNAKTTEKLEIIALFATEIVKNTVLAQGFRGAPGRRSRQDEFSENLLGLKKGLPLITPLIKICIFLGLERGGALEGDFGAIFGEKNPVESQIYSKTRC